MQISHPKQTETASQILNRTFLSDLEKDQRIYAKTTFKKIYSEQMAKVMNEKKFIFLAERNKHILNQLQEVKIQSKILQNQKMQDLSFQRKTNLLKDKIKRYQLEEKKWIFKKNQIQRQFQVEEKQMLENAIKYRQNQQKQWRLKSESEKRNLKKSSEKYHVLFDSKSSKIRSKTTEISEFDEQKYKRLKEVRRRNVSLNQDKCSYLHETLKEHQRRCKMLQDEKEKKGYEKMGEKLNRMIIFEKIRASNKKKQVEQLSKSSASFKKYPNNQPCVGQQCQKHKKKILKVEHNLSLSRHSQFKEHNLVSSRIKTSEDQITERHQRNTILINMYKKNKQIQIAKLLKTKVRSFIHSQLKLEQSKDLRIKTQL